ncbi:hypothetical protein SBA7_650007 [Candidatus Sulfotelmatobacter sp. SbA7]|nr:hypothetical protein SBA7_650007 [Candidatus Sulfotelmatobacter sp. SbA7]
MFFVRQLRLMDLIICLQVEFLVISERSFSMSQTPYTKGAHASTCGDSLSFCILLSREARAFSCVLFATHEGHLVSLVRRKCVSQELGPFAPGGAASQRAEIALGEAERFDGILSVVRSVGRASRPSRHG